MQPSLFSDLAPRIYSVNAITSYIKERLEADLSQKSAEFQSEIARARQTPGQLQAVLPQETALIDFLEYTRITRRGNGKSDLDQTPHLLAFVVRPDRPIQQIDLGPVELITAAIDHWRSGLLPAEETETNGRANSDSATLARRVPTTFGAAADRAGCPANTLA